MASQKEWPRGQADGSERRGPTATFLAPDGALKSNRSLAGPLRTGTAPGVGPRDAAPNGGSDFGMDRITPRDFDPMGTTRRRFGEIPSELISRR